MLVSFALEWWEMKTICCTICCCAVPSVWTWRLCLFSISWGKKCRPEQADPQHFLSLEAGRSYSHCSTSLNSSVDMWRVSWCRNYSYKNQLGVKQQKMWWFGQIIWVKRFCCYNLWERVWNWGHCVFKDLTSWHFLLLCSRTFSVFVCTLTAVRGFI